jgi:hypothetical protein
MKNSYLKALSEEKAIEIARVADQASVEYYNDASEMDPMERFFHVTESKGKSASLLQSLLKELSVEEMSELTALAILGRKASDESLEDWNGLLINARAQQNSSDNDTSYLSSKLPLGEYLFAGLEEMGVCVERDRPSA